MAFLLHSQLAADTAPVLDLSLCSVRLMDCRHLPWLVLIPHRENCRDTIDLGDADQVQLTREIAAASRTIRKLFNPHKLNVAALGNLVPQLHVHVLARFESDPAWPKPVWGNIPIESYAETERLQLTADLIKNWQS